MFCTVTELTCGKWCINYNYSVIVYIKSACSKYLYFPRRKRHRPETPHQDHPECLLPELWWLEDSQGYSLTGLIDRRRLQQVNKSCDERPVWRVMIFRWYVGEVDTGGVLNLSWLDTQLTSALVGKHSRLACLTVTKRRRRKKWWLYVIYYPWVKTQQLESTREADGRRPNSAQRPESARIALVN